MQGCHFAAFFYSLPVPIVTLVDFFITTRKKAIAFVDNDTEWKMDTFAETNAAVLQQLVIPRASNGFHIPV
jgi:ABC-type molybdate transport system permease subunit